MTEYFVEFDSKKRPGTIISEKCSSLQEAEARLFDYRRTTSHNARIVGKEVGKG